MNTKILNYIINKNPEMSSYDAYQLAKKLSVDDDTEIGLLLNKKFKLRNGAEIIKKIPNEFPYIIDRLIPKNAITALTADSGAGKSLVMLLMVDAIINGNALFDTFITEENKVLIIDQEMDEDLLIGRFKSILSGNQDKLDIIYEQFITIDNPDNFKWLIDTIKVNNYGLVVFDTLTMIHNSEENSSSEMRKINELMLKIIAETGTTILYLHHHRKTMNGEKAGISSSRGSTEIIAKVASHLQIESNKKKIDDDIILEIKLSQAKSRRPESINKIGFEIRYSDNKTLIEYMGDVDEDKKAIEEAVEMIKNLFGRDNSRRTVEAIISNFENNGVRIGESSVRIALKSMCESGIMNKKTKKQIIEAGGISEKEAVNYSSRANYYKML